MDLNRKSTLKIIVSVSVVLMLLTLIPSGVSAGSITKDFHSEKSLGDHDRDRLRDGSCLLSSSRSSNGNGDCDRLRDGSCLLSSRSSNCNGDCDRLRDGSCSSSRSSNCNGDRDRLRDGSCVSATSGI